MPAIKATGFLVTYKQNIADSCYPDMGFVGDCWMGQSKTSSLNHTIIKHHSDYEWKNE